MSKPKMYTQTRLGCRYNQDQVNQPLHITLHKYLRSTYVAEKQKTKLYLCSCTYVRLYGSGLFNFPDA